MNAQQHRHQAVSDARLKRTAEKKDPQAKGRQSQMRSIEGWRVIAWVSVWSLLRKGRVGHHGEHQKEGPGEPANPLHCSQVKEHRDGDLGRDLVRARREGIEDVPPVQLPGGDQVE